jgi:DNA-binding SARP family transcriptional activator
VELPFESWVATYRGSLEIGLLSLLERAVLAAYEMGDLDRAIDLSARAARIDPADGGLLERLAILLDEDGATVSAHRAARRALLLLDELSIAPNPQLRRISGGKGPSPQ